MPSFTTQSSNLLQNGPTIELKITIPGIVEEQLREQNQDVPQSIASVGLIDTGASSSVISEKVVQQLGLNPIDIVTVHTPSSHNVQYNRYYVRFLFPNNIVYEGHAIATPLKGQDIQCLIGRDVLSNGVLVYIGYVNTFSLSF